MKIKNQFLISITIFAILLVVIASSVLVTQQEVNQMVSQEANARSLEARASNLAYLATDYFLFQQESGLTLWQTEYNSLTVDLSRLSVTTARRQTLLNNVKDDVRRLSARWNEVVVYLQEAARNVSVRELTAFQSIWGRMSLQSQSLIFDAQQLSQSFQREINALNSQSIFLIIVLISAFGAYFVTNYLLTYRNTLKSISDLQAGIAVLGSGNLDYSLKASKKDEIGAISSSINQMASNLKTVTATKTELEQAQASLQASEERWATTLASIGDAVIAMDTSGKVEFMNSEAEDLTGWTLSEVSGKSVKEVFKIINEQSRLQVEGPIDRVLREGMVVGLANHTVLIRKDGTEVPIDDSGAPIRDKEGKTTGVVLIFRDITERKEAEEKLEEYAKNLEALVEERTKKLASSALYARRLIEASLDPLVTISLEGKITDVNKATELATGCQREELIGSDFSDYFTEPENASAGYKQVFTEGFVKDYPLAIRHKSGRITNVLYNAAVYRNEAGEIQGVFAAARDITELRKVEAQAQEAEKKLRDAERLAAIGATAGMVGHDIRNPLQAITSDVYLAKTELASTPEGECKQNALESLTEIEKNISYIDKIVQDLQDYARPLRAVATEAKLEGIIGDLLKRNGLPPNIKVKFKVEKEADAIIADPDLLRRAIGNLVTNAVQAMPGGGKLNISATKEGNDTVITVQDTGVGIPEDVRPKLFTPLFTTKSKGQGFGLAVVKRLTETMGGTVTFESEIGKGTKFILRLPPPEINDKLVFKSP